MNDFIKLFLLFLLYKNYYSLPFFKNSIQNKNQSKLKTTYIYGHKSPDCDSICSAICLADYLKKIGYISKEIIPCRLGELNKEIKYALNKFEVDTPLLISNLTGDYEVFLVDHNTPSQSIVIDRSKIVGLIDHHALNNFETLSPIKAILNPIGSTCTIIYDLFKSNNIEISNKTAGLLITGIISDTLLLKKTSTTTQEDIEAFNDLTNILKLNSTQYGYDVLLQSTDISDLTEKDIINMDTKSYVINKYPIQISSIHTVNVTDVLTRKESFIKEIDSYNKKHKKELFVLMIVDIINMDTTILVRGNYFNVVETAFDLKLKDNQALLKGVNSRKTDVYPHLAKAFDDLEEYDGPYINNDDEENKDSQNEKESDNDYYKILIIFLSILGFILIIAILLLIIKYRKRRNNCLQEEIRKSFPPAKELKETN